MIPLMTPMQSAQAVLPALPFPPNPAWLRDYDPIPARETGVVALAFRGDTVFVLSQIRAGTISISGFDPDEKPRRGTADILLTKCDRETGKVVWRYVFDSDEHGDESATAIHLAQNGDLVIGGTTDAGLFNTGRVEMANDATHLLVITVSPDGKPRWTARWRSEVSGVVSPPASLVAGKSGAVYVLAGLFLEVGQKADAVLAKFVDGKLVWLKRIMGAGASESFAPGEVVINADASETVTLCGSASRINTAPDANGRFPFLAQYLSSGKPYWTRRFLFGDAMQNGFHRLVRDPTDGSFFAGGGSGVAHISPGGDILWKTDASQSFAKNAPVIVRPENLALGAGGDVFVRYRFMQATHGTDDTAKTMRFDRATGAVIAEPNP